MKMPKYKRMPTLEEMKQKHGKPTVSEGVNAFYLLAGLCDLADECEYLHNFQLERSDIVEYVYRTHEILRVLKGDKT